MLRFKVKSGDLSIGELCDGALARQLNKPVHKPPKHSKQNLPNCSDLLDFNPSSDAKRAKLGQIICIEELDSRNEDENESSYNDVDSAKLHVEDEHDEDDEVFSPNFDNSVPTEFKDTQMMASTEQCFEDER